MNIRWNIVIAGVLGTVAGFLLSGQAPVGGAIWPPAHNDVQPEGANLALLMVMGGIEAVAFGAGVAFLVAAWPWVKSKAGGSWSWPVYLAVGWSLVNWVPHTSLHMAVGNLTTQSAYAGLVGIEYGFHFTLIAGGLVLASYAVRSVAVGMGRGTTQGTGNPTPTSRKAT